MPQRGKTKISLKESHVPKIESGSNKNDACLLVTREEREIYRGDVRVFPSSCFMGNESQFARRVKTDKSATHPVMR